MQKRLPLLFIILLLSSVTYGQSLESIRKDVTSILKDKKAKVGVSIIGNRAADTLSINGQDHFPMQSVFKFHIALTVLSQVEQGRFTLDSIVHINKDQLLPGLYSPLREKYPDGVAMKVSEIIEYTVSKSDNVGCDALLRLVGGPAVVENYIQAHGFPDYSVKINEETMQSNWDLQFQNWTTPVTSSRLLHYFYSEENLPGEHHDFLWNIMKKTETGALRLKGQLPEGTVVAHKTGWSGSNNEGITAAVNDVGIVFLPDGRYFAISVFITDSREDTVTNERIIADICKVAWEYFTSL